MAAPQVQQKAAQVQRQFAGLGLGQLSAISALPGSR